MNIAFGHTNMDFDCFGSLVFIKKLFPDYKLVRSSRIHPAAHNLYDYYENYFNFLVPQDISGEKIENIIIVDTCMADRVKEYFSYLRNSTPAVMVFDHHQTDNCDIPGAQVVVGSFGANTSLLGKMAMQKGIVLEPEEATIALTAIYADTGRLIHENVTKDDFEVSAWLLGMGASLRLVKSFLETVKEDDQIAVLNQLQPDTQIIQGHVILFSYLELEKNVPGLSAVVEKIMDIHSPDAYFAVFFIPKEKTILIIARSQKKIIDLEALLSVYRGGGHQLAASAKIINNDGPEFYKDFRYFLDYALEPAARARDIMTKDIPTVHEKTTLLEASIFMEQAELSSVPVLNNEGDVTGLISLRDVMNGRKHGKMQAPVTAYMSRPVISTGSKATMREIERIFYKHKINCLPVIDDSKLLGIITRWDYLNFQKLPLED
jgi:tRNA nucleotidyltransferase (CCA-adding enzyme)